jgi:hypothetical protein
MAFRFLAILLNLPVTFRDLIVNRLDFNSQMSRVRITLQPRKQRPPPVRQFFNAGFPLAGRTHHQINLGLQYEARRLFIIATSTAVLRPHARERSEPLSPPSKKPCVRCHLSVALVRSGAAGVGVAGVHGVVRFGGVAPLSTAFFGFFISRLRLSRFPRFPIVFSSASSIIAAMRSPNNNTGSPNTLPLHAPPSCRGRTPQVRSYIQVAPINKTGALVFI